MSLAERPDKIGYQYFPFHSLKEDTNGNHKY